CRDSVYRLNLNGKSIAALGTVNANCIDDVLPIEAIQFKLSNTGEAEGNDKVVRQCHMEVGGSNALGSRAANTNLKLQTRRQAGAGRISVKGYSKDLGVVK